MERSLYKIQNQLEKIFHSVKYVVEWGLYHRSIEDITAIGVDEIQWRKGHKYLTLVYQINSHCVRLLWIGRERTIDTKNIISYLPKEFNENHYIDENKFRRNRKITPKILAL